MKTVSRRLFLRGAGGAALAMPVLDSLLPHGVQAAPAAKRFIVFKSFSTQLIKEWYPTSTPAGYAVKNGTTRLTKVIPGTGYTQAPLADFKTPTGVSGILGPNLNKHLPKLTLIRGLDFLPTVNHNYGGLLGNFSSCTKATPCEADKQEDVPTIDQVMAYSKKFYPDAPPLRSLRLSQGVADSMSFSDGGVVGAAVQQLKARVDPVTAFGDVFGGPAGGGMMGMDPKALERDTLLVDRVFQDYTRLKQNKRLSAADKKVVEQYANLVAELQAKLKKQPSLSCTKPMMPQAMADNNGTNPTDIKTKWDIYLDLVTAAIMCDRTRLVTLGVHKALGPGPDAANTALTGFYHSEDANGGTWHGLAHDWGNPNARRMLKGVNSWVANELFAKLLDKLDVPESSGRTYLDNSLVYWGNELGFNHIAYSIPCLLAGSAGGFISTGRYLDYIDWEKNRIMFSQEDGPVIKGIPHNQFLVTVMQSMGLAPADYERGGQPGYGQTSTVGRDPKAWPVDYDMANIGKILPGIQG